MKTLTVEHIDSVEVQEQIVGDITFNSPLLVIEEKNLIIELEKGDTAVLTNSHGAILGTYQV